MTMILAIDFDGTLVEHCFPEIGAEVPLAFHYLQEFQKRGMRLILHTIRSDAFATSSVSPSSEILVHDGRMYLSEAVEFCRVRGIEFWSINKNPEQHTWSQSPKSYAHLYIDDAAYGCPLIHPDHRHDCSYNRWSTLRCNCDVGKRRPYADWSIIGPAVLNMLER
jgi:hypothetical protein